MSFSFKIVAGDLDTTSNVLGTVYGVEKLAQDLSLWLRENYGIDRFHPTYGSVLDSYIGEIIGPLTLHDVEGEVNRVLVAFQKVQKNALKKNPLRFSRDELLDRIESIKCSLSFDKVYVNISFRTAQGTPGNINESIS